MIVVVGGQARKVGKTRAVCDIISATPEAAWVAVKITPHGHPEPSRDPDTDRYLRAGAAESRLLTGHPPLALPHGRNLIVESTSILDQLTPDLFFLIVDPANPDWKPSAERHRTHPAAIEVSGLLQPEHLELVRSRLAR